MLRYVVLVHINVIAVGLHVAVEDKRRVHKGARVNKTSSLLDLHLLDIEYEAAVEDMESNSALPTKKNNLVVSDLVCQSHV